MKDDDVEQIFPNPGPALFNELLLCLSMFLLMFSIIADNDTRATMTSFFLTYPSQSKCLLHIVKTAFVV